MNRYRMSITQPPPLPALDFECEAETSEQARQIGREQHPGARVGYAFRVSPASEVPRNRPANSRYHLVDVDKMGADGAPPLRRHGSESRSPRRRRRIR